MFKNVIDYTYMNYIENVDLGGFNHFLMEFGGVQCRCGGANQKRGDEVHMLSRRPRASAEDILLDFGSCEDEIFALTASDIGCDVREEVIA